jgi:hypothetical protein
MHRAAAFPKKGDDGLHHPQTQKPRPRMLDRGWQLQRDSCRKVTAIALGRRFDHPPKIYPSLSGSCVTVLSW